MYTTSDLARHTGFRVSEDILRDHGLLRFAPITRSMGGETLNVPEILAIPGSGLVPELTVQIMHLVATPDEDNTTLPGYRDAADRFPAVVKFFQDNAERIAETNQKAWSRMTDAVEGHVRSVTRGADSDPMGEMLLEQFSLASDIVDPVERMEAMASVGANILHWHNTTMESTREESGGRVEEDIIDGIDYQEYIGNLFHDLR